MSARLWHSERWIPVATVGGLKTMPPTVALLVIAHPDDECMFFGPLLLASQGTYQWKVLCLSTGADGIVNDMQVVDSQHRL